MTTITRKAPPKTGPGTGAKKVAGATGVAKKGFPAKRPAGSAPAKKAARAPKLTYPAPADFKPAFYEVRFRTSIDGLIGPEFKVERVKGGWDKAENPRYDLAEYDVPTLIALASRLQARLFATKVEKRLPPKTMFKIVFRVNKKRDTGALSVLYKAAAQYVKNEKNGKMRTKWFGPEDNREQTVRLLKKGRAIWPGAFTNAQLPPSRRKKAEEDDE